MICLIIKHPYKKWINEETIKKVAEFTLAHLSHPNTDISISITNNREIQKLNKQFRNVDSPTDVLSFSSNEIDPQTNRVYAGDIIISFQRAKEQAVDLNHPIMKEISILIVHGILHLFGYDHLKQVDKIIMFSLQDEIINKLDLLNA